MFVWQLLLYQRAQIEQGRCFLPVLKQHELRAIQREGEATHALKV